MYYIVHNVLIQNHIIIIIKFQTIIFIKYILHYIYIYFNNFELTQLILDICIYFITLFIL